MEIFSRNQIFTFICSLIFLITVVGITAYTVNPNVSFKVSSLSEFGTFFGGILGPLLTFMTVILLLKDKEDREKKDQLNSALKMYDYLKVILDNKEREFKCYGLDGNGHNILYKGLDVIDYFRSGAELTKFNQDCEYVFIWMEDYISNLRKLFKLLEINQLLRDVLLYDFSSQTKILLDSSISFKEYENMGVFDDSDNIKNSLKRSRADLFYLFPDRLQLKD